MVAIQFIDVTFGEFGGFVLSFQKLAIALLLPVGLLLVGKFSIPPALGATAALFGIALVAAPSLDGADAPGLAALVITLGFTVIAVSATAVSFALLPDAVGTFARIWAPLAAISGILTMCQAVGVFPLLTVSEQYLGLRTVGEGLVRGSGLKLDPNFQAIVLVIGAAFVGIYYKRWSRMLGLILISGGVVATFSRMGLVLLVLVLLFALPPIREEVKGRPVGAVWIPRAATLVVIAAMALAVYRVAPTGLQGYFIDRFFDIGSVWDNLLSGAGPDSVFESSGAQRTGLLLATMELIAVHPIAGVGGGQVPSHLYAMIGVQNAVHNTYLELFAAGGAFGAVALASYLGSGRHAFALFKRDGAPRDVRALSLFMWILGGAGLLISLTYNLIIWLPLGILLGVSARRPMGVRRRSPLMGVKQAGGHRKPLADSGTSRLELRGSAEWSGEPHHYDLHAGEDLGRSGDRS